SIRVVLEQAVYRFVVDDPSAPRERAEPVEWLRGLRRFGPGCREASPGELRDDPSGRLLLSAREIPRGLEHIVVDVERGAHASDAIASRCSRQPRRQRPETGTSGATRLSGRQLERGFRRTRNTAPRGVSTVCSNRGSATQ